MKVTILDDFHETKKYRLSQPYGNSDAETANLQYCAVLLRTVDLLQITNHRAPSTLFRLINPTDPISQQEWVKQNAVTRVRPKVGLDKDGNANASAVADTIEVFAEFDDENGFFGLTSYLAYARDQLKKSYDVVDKSRKLSARTYLFPWRDIDDSHVEAQGFIKEPFGFQLDQAKILDLLTGHTLYNNSNVVIRELLQNAIDAVRLQSLIDKSDTQTAGQVEVTWNSDEGILEILDNGTGMTQEVIENHLLKVGSSRYQSVLFKEKFPSFSSISRFGIGVLSAFMVADTVQITTASNDEAQARQISLRSVHGKYLIRLLDKDGSVETQKIRSHGTLIRLKFRSSIRAFDVSVAMRRWILFPQCAVWLTVDGRERTKVGYESPKAALQAFIDAELPHHRWGAAIEYKIEEKNLDGLTIAYALESSSIFRDWTFVNIRKSEKSEDYGQICTCVEGIAVEFSSPGFDTFSIAAIANAHGNAAPKTNVARSSIEDTDEKRNLLRKIYGAYFSAISEETQRLVKQEKFSLSWAVSQVTYLSYPIIGTMKVGGSRHLQREALGKLPMFLVEDESKRKATSVEELKSQGSFWTIQSELVAAAERLLRSAPAEMTLRQLTIACGPKANPPPGLIVCDLRSGTLPLQILGSQFEVSALIAKNEDLRVDVQWKAIDEDDPRWVSTQKIGEGLDRRTMELLSEASRGIRNARRIRDVTFIPRKKITTEGLDRYAGVRVHGQIYLLSTQPIGEFLRRSLEASTPMECVVFASIFSNFEGVNLKQYEDAAVEIDKELSRVVERFGNVSVPNKREFISTLIDSNLEVFDPFARSNRSAEFDFIL